MKSGYANKAVLDEIVYYVDAIYVMDCTVLDVTPYLRAALNEVISAHRHLESALEEIEKGESDE